MENISEIFECENILRNYYKITNEEKIIKLKTEFKKNNTIINKEYNLFYKIDNINFQQLDLSICSCKEEKCSLCSNSSIKYNLCIFCKENFYPILNDSTNIYSFINCYQNPEGYYLDINDSFYKPCHSSCKNCDIKGDEEIHNCISCLPGYLYEFNINNYTNCYKNCKYYFYFDNKTNEYFCTSELKCPNEYSKLKTDNNQCVEDCKTDSIYKYEFKKKCYSICPNNTELSQNKDYYCNVKCPQQYPFEIISTQECVSNCSINARKNNLCITNYISTEKEYSSAVQDEAINNIREDLTNGFDTSDIDDGGDIVIEEKGTKLTITTTENQKNSETNKNATTINLGECETKLKDYYKIPLNKSLYILKLDVLQEGMKIPKIEYEVYYNLDGKNLVKLNLTVCENTKIDISLPVEINEDLDKLNSSSAYYNDICYTSTADTGTDISLSDRKNDFIKNNKTVCEENCEFTKYNYETGKAVCSCDIKINIPSVSDINIDKNKFFKSFTDINNIINYKIMKCYKNLLNIENIKRSFGSLILIPLILFHFICLIIACIKGNKELKKRIELIVKAKNYIQLNKNDNIKCKNLGNFEKNIEKPDKKNNNQINIKQENTENNNENNNKDIKKIIFKKFKKKIKKKKKFIKNIELNETKNSHPIKSQKKLSIKNSDKDLNSKKGKKFSMKKIKTENIEESENSKGNLFLQKSNINNLYLKATKKYKKLTNLLNPTENEINSFSYQEAVKSDKRTFFQYYCSLIKTQHSISFSFCPMIDYNIKIIKVDLFFIDIIINYAINALFFNDSTMHQIYEDQGEFNMYYQIPQIIYSSLISQFFSSIIKLTALTEDIVLKIKSYNNIRQLKIIKEKAFKVLNIKFILFSIISSILLMVFFYYVDCFCVIYKNTQIHLIKDFIFSFGLSLLYPFAIYLLPGIFRILALNNKKRNREILYKISIIIQDLF